MCHFWKQKRRRKNWRLSVPWLKFGGPKRSWKYLSGVIFRRKKSWEDGQPMSLGIIGCILIIGWVLLLTCIGVLSYEVSCEVPVINTGVHAMCGGNSTNKNSVHIAFSWGHAGHRHYLSPTAVPGYIWRSLAFYFSFCFARKYSAKPQSDSFRCHS